MASSRLKDLLAASLPIIKEAGNFLRQEMGRVTADKVETKELNSLVSYVDKGAEKLLVEGLSHVLPNATFITEEETVENRSSAQTWIIDPLDGTTNFLFGVPHFAVSVGLMEEQIITLGMIYNPMTAECFMAIKDGGAYLNGHPIQVRNTPVLAEALLATGFPYNEPSRVNKQVQLIEHFKNRSRGIRRTGAAALDLAFVAAGRYSGYFEGAVHAWDVAAGILLVQEAGGIVTDFKGGEDYLFGGEIIATGPQLQLDLLEKIKAVYHPDF